MEKRRILTSYEEYYPYGSTAWWAGAGSTVSQKRYRYTGMEKDEETGLSYHHHRYYATWLARWTSSDPIGLRGGINLYGYCHGQPVGDRDANGCGNLIIQLLSDTPTPKSKEELQVEHVYDTGYAVGLAHGRFAANYQDMWAKLPAWKVRESDVAAFNEVAAAEKAKLPRLTDYHRRDWNAAAREGYDRGFLIGQMSQKAETFVIEQAEWVGASAAAEAIEGATLSRGVSRGGTSSGVRRYRVPLNSSGIIRDLAGVRQIAEGIAFGDYADVNVVIGRASMFEEGTNAAYMFPANLGAGGKLINPRDFLLGPNGEWLVRLNPAILGSDVAIAATLSHEATEIRLWSALLEDMDAQGISNMTVAEFSAKMQSFHNIAMEEERRIALALGAEPIP